jgi:hypothetical protein
MLNEVRIPVDAYRRDRAGTAGVRGSGKEQGGRRNNLKGGEVVA